MSAKLAEERFMEKVVPLPNGCWLWDRAMQSRGYGSFSFGGRGKSVLAHRWSYEHYVGPIPLGFELDHVCHSNDLTCPGGKCIHRLCVNPAHLEPVTARVNNRRGVRARRTECTNGHPYTPENTITKRNGTRNCRSCQVAWSAGWRAARRESVVAS